MSDFLHELNVLAHNQPEAIDAWFAEHYDGKTIPVYSSVDIRNAGFKLAPVDTNLFPAGFNNLNAASQTRAVAALKAHIKRMKVNVNTILIMSENHTRNKHYFDNVAMLMHLTQQAGCEVRIGRFDLDGTDTLETETTGEQIITAEAIMREEDILKTVSGFVPDMILVNNDLSTGCPPILCNIRQPVFPSAGMGWYRRRKSVHFDAYNQVVRQFSQHFDIDSWLLSTVIHHCGKINFKERKGMECVAIGVDKAIHKIKQKYSEHGITHDPYVYIKADNGTYGMGIMTVRSGEEVYELNKKTRNKMNVIKEGVENSEVIIQEGVPTQDNRHGAVAEPMIYLMGAQVISKIWRINEGRNNENSLNATGMVFEPFSEEAFAREAGLDIVARLATLATIYEDYDSSDIRHNS